MSRYAIFCSRKLSLILGLFFTFCVISLTAKEVSEERKSLSEAIRSKNIWLIKKLMESNAISVDELSESSHTPLIEAAYEGDVAAVSYFIEKGADVNYKSTSWRGTPLNNAANGWWKKDPQKSEIIRKLIDAGAMVNEMPSSEPTPFMRVCSDDAIKCAEIFIEAGVDLEAQTFEGKTALMYAISKDKSAVATRLIQQGVNLEAKDAKGRTALFYAIQEKNTFLVDLLIKSRAETNLQDYEGTPLFMYGISSGIPAITKLFISSSFDPKSVNHHNQTALHFVALTNDIETAKFLLEQGLNINARDNTGETPFVKAIVEDKMLMVNFLASKNADINVLDNQGRSVLYLAVHKGKGSFEPIRFLIEKHASLDAPDSYGLTPFMLAIIQGSYELTSLLLKAGANVNARTTQVVTITIFPDFFSGVQVPSRTTPLELAKLFKREEIATLLSSQP